MVKKESNRQDPKRRCRRNSSTAGVNKTNQYRPDNAVSVSSSNNNQQLSSSVEQQQNQHLINNYVVPSARDISKVLVKIDNYNQSCDDIWHNQRQELVTIADVNTAPDALQALKHLQEQLSLSLSMSKKDGDEIGRVSDVLEHFHCFGGITRVVEFLDTAITAITIILPAQHPQYNTQMQMNTSIVGAVSKFLSYLLSIRWINFNATTNTTANVNAIVNANANANGIEMSLNNSHNKTKTLAIEMAKMIVRRDGIELLLRCCYVNNNIDIYLDNHDENYNYATLDSLLTTKQHIWTVLGRTINIDNLQYPDKTVGSKGFVDKSQKLCILHQATTDCTLLFQQIEKQQKYNNNNDRIVSTMIMTANMHVLRVLLYTIANTIKDDQLGKDELKQTNLKSVCLRLLLLLKREMHDIINSNNKEEVVTYVLGILTILSKKKILSKKNDFEQLLPTLLFCLTYFSRGQGQSNNNNQIRSFVLILLELSCTKLDTKTMEDSGVLEVIPAVLLRTQSNTSSSSDNDNHHHPTGAQAATTISISEEMKEKARSIMRMILK